MIADAATGLEWATFALAGVTAVAVWAGLRTAKHTKEVARATAGLAAATAKLAATAELELTAQLRPILVEAPVNRGVPQNQLIEYPGTPQERRVWPNDIAAFDDDGNGHCGISIAVRNVGAGTAVLTAPPTLNDPGNVEFPGEAASPIVAPNETTRLTFTLPETVELTNVRIAVSYTDVGGQQASTSRFFVRLVAPQTPSPFIVAGFQLETTNRPTVTRGLGFN